MSGPWGTLKIEKIAPCKEIQEYTITKFSAMKWGTWKYKILSFYEHLKNELWKNWQQGN